MAQLLEGFEHTQRGDGRILFVTGEPGIGKSRLLHELRRRLGDRVSWMEGRCASLGRSIAFHPLIDLLKRTFGIEEGAAAETAADRIDRGVRRLGGEAAEIVPYLCWLLSIDSGNPSIAAMDPQTRRGEMLAALRRVLELAAQARPLVLVLEDLHWSDVATEDFLIGLADTLSGQRILLILTYRPGYEHRFGNRPYATQIDLVPLSGEDSGAMAEQMLAASGFAPPLRSLIATKGEGNPFYIEELLRSLRETGAMRATAAGYELVGRADEVAVPESVQDLIAARIDRLDDGPKELLQTASGIGREFSHRLLVELAHGEHAEVHLRDLEASQLIETGSDPFERAYKFHHALTQEVAYGSLLGPRRREIHTRIAAAIEALATERLAEHYEVLAHHLFEGEELEKALDYLL